MKLRYKSLAFILVTSILITQPVYAEVKDNVGGMDTGPVYDEVNNKQTVSAGADQILAGYSAWVNGEPVIGTLNNEVYCDYLNAQTEINIGHKPKQVKVMARDVSAGQIYTIYSFYDGTTLTSSLTDGGDSRHNFTNSTSRRTYTFEFTNTGVKIRYDNSSTNNGSYSSSLLQNISYKAIIFVK